MVPILSTSELQRRSSQELQCLFRRACSEIAQADADKKRAICALNQVRTAMFTPRPP